MSLGVRIENLLKRAKLEVLKNNNEHAELLTEEAQAMQNVEEQLTELRTRVDTLEKVVIANHGQAS